MSSPNETDGLEDRPIDPRELGLERGRGGERGEDRWDPLDIYSDFVLRRRSEPRRVNGQIAVQGKRQSLRRPVPNGRNEAWVVVVG